MRNRLSVLFGSLALVFASGSVFANIHSIDGLWEARYEKTNTPSSHVRITTLPNGEVQGVVEAAYPRPGERPSPNCTACTGENKDKPIVGMKILWGMKLVGHNQWDNGEVLDPETGKIYSGKMTLSENGNSLDMRGYVLTPLFGSTDTWTRIGAAKPAVQSTSHSTTPAK